MIISKEQARLIMSNCKTTFSYMESKLFWKDSQELNYDDKILYAYLKSINDTLKLDIELDLGKDKEFSDITHDE